MDSAIYVLVLLARLHLGLQLLLTHYTRTQPTHLMSEHASKDTVAEDALVPPSTYLVILSKRTHISDIVCIYMYAQYMH
jgi:siroheme synthase